MTLKTAAIGGAILLAGALLLVTGQNYARNKDLENQVRELTALVQQLTDVRQADSAAFAERARALRESEENAQKRQSELEDAGMADSDADFLDALRRLFGKTDLPDK